MLSSRAFFQDKKEPWENQKPTVRLETSQLCCVCKLLSHNPSAGPVSQGRKCPLMCPASRKIGLTAVWVSRGVQGTAVTSARCHHGAQGTAVTSARSLHGAQGTAGHKSSSGWLPHGLSCWWSAAGHSTPRAPSALHIMHRTALQRAFWKSGSKLIQTSL